MKKIIGKRNQIISDNDFASINQGHQISTRKKTCDLDITLLVPGKYQPRKVFSEKSLTDLATSIKENGIIQPLVVRSIADNSGQFRYEIIVGERRWRASKLAGLYEVPVIIKRLSDKEAATMAVEENIKHKTLNVMEQSFAMFNLKSEFSMTDEQIGRVVSKSRSAVTNILRLMKLTDEVKKMLANGDIEMGHARAILSLEDDCQKEVANDIIKNQLTVREAEAKVSLLHSPELVTDEVKAENLSNKLARKTGLKVNTTLTKKGQIKVVLEMKSVADFKRLISNFD